MTNRSMMIRAAAAVMALLSVPAGATSFAFTQGGFADGATFSGTFSGTDFNNNGQLSDFDGEITDFSADFSGNSLLPSIHFDFWSLFGLVYDLDGYLGDGTDGDMEGLAAFDGQYYYAAGAGPFLPCDGMDVCSLIVDYDLAVGDLSDQGLTVTALAAPEPASWAMMVGGFGLVGGALRNRRRAVSFT